MSNFDLTLQHRHANSGAYAASACCVVLEVQFRVHKIILQDLRYEISGQWLAEDIAKSFLGVILGPLSETLYDAILRRCQPGKARRVTLLLPQQSPDHRLSDPLVSRICN